jgi:hypothetical protein
MNRLFLALVTLSLRADKPVTASTLATDFRLESVMMILQHYYYGIERNVSIPIPKYITATDWWLSHPVKFVGVRLDESKK